MNRLLAISTCRLGEWRTDLIWRALGWSLFLNLLIQYNWLGKRFLAYEASLELLAVGLSGLLLMAFGARLVSIMAAALAMIAVHWRTFAMRASPDYAIHSHTAEFVLFAFLPVATCVLLVCTLAAGRRTLGERSSDCIPRDLQREIDLAVTALIRWSLVISVFFTGFHKTNADFLNPEVSCAIKLTGYAEALWKAPHSLMVLFGNPLVVLTTELALIPLLLVFLPRLGLAFLCVFFFGVSLAGALAPTTVTICCGLAFLGAEHRDAIVAGFKRHRLAIALLILSLLLGARLAYRGTRFWIMWAPYQTIVLLVLTSSLLALGEDLRRTRASPLLAWRALLTGNALSESPSTRAARMTTACMAVLLVINCMTPYTGLKFRYSLAMISNLRADGHRWNSYLVPAWLGRFTLDPYVLVEKVTREEDDDGKEPERAEPQALEPVTGERYRMKNNRLTPGLYGPREFARRIVNERLKPDETGPVSIVIRYKGETMRFADIAREEEIESFIDGLPRLNLYGKKMTVDGPQPCNH